MNKKATGLKNLSKFSEITLFGCRGENISKHKTINNFISRQAVIKNMNTSHENFKDTNTATKILMNSNF